MIYLFLADGFEETEAVATADMIKRAGLKISLCGIKSTLVKGAHNISVATDCTIDNHDFSDGEGFILPGGMPGTLNLGDCKKLEEIIKNANKDKKCIAAICAAPSVLAKWGILDGKKATVYPSFKEEIEMFGAIYKKDPIICDNIITANGPDTAIDFGLLIVQYFCGKDKSREIKESL